jgi:hypothetical protein
MGFLIYWLGWPDKDDEWVAEMDIDAETIELI